MNANYLLLFGFLNVALYLYITALNPQQKFKLDPDDDNIIDTARHFCYGLIISSFASLSFLICGKFLMSLVNIFPVLWGSYLFGRYCALVYKFKGRKDTVAKILEKNESKSSYALESIEKKPLSVTILVRDMICCWLSEFLENLFNTIDNPIPKTDEENKAEAHPFARLYKSYEDIESELPAVVAIGELFSAVQKGILYLTIFTFGVDVMKAKWFANFILLIGFVNLALYFFLTFFNPAKKFKFDPEDDNIDSSARHFCYGIFTSIFSVITFLLCKKFLLAGVNLVPLILESYVYGRYCSFVFKYKEKRDTVSKILERNEPKTAITFENIESEPLSVGILVRDMIFSALSDGLENVFTAIDKPIYPGDDEIRRGSHPFARLVRSYEDIDSELPAVVALAEVYSFIQKGIFYFALFSFGVNFLGGV